MALDLYNIIKTSIDITVYRGEITSVVPLYLPEKGRLTRCKHSVLL